MNLSAESRERSNKLLEIFVEEKKENPEENFLVFHKKKVYAKAYHSVLPSGSSLILAKSGGDENPMSWPYFTYCEVIQKYLFDEERQKDIEREEKIRDKHRKIKRLYMLLNSPQNIFKVDPDEEEKIKKIKKSFFGSEKETPKDVIEPLTKKEEDEIERMEKDVGYEVIHNCFKGNLSRIKRLIRKGRDLNVCDEHHNTALHFAIAKREPLIVKELLLYDDLLFDVPNTAQYTALHIAAKIGDVEIMKMLIRKGADVNRTAGTFNSKVENLSDKSSVKKCIEEEKEKEGLFFHVVEKGEINAVKKMLVSNEGIGNINCKNDDGQTAFDIALKQKNYEVIKLLVSMKDRDVDFSMSEFVSKCEDEETKLYVLKLSNEKKIRRVLCELLSSEKTYVDDLRICAKLFPDESKIKDCIEKDDYVELIISIRKNLLDVLNCHKNFLKTLMRLYSSNASTIEIVESLKIINFKFYELLIPKSIHMAELFSLKEKSLTKLFLLLKQREKRIPYPKIPRINSLLDKPRVRMIKYKDFILRLSNYESKNNEKILNVLKFIEDIIVKIDGTVRKQRSDKKMKLLDRIFQLNFNCDLLLKRGITTERKYVHHETAIKTKDNLLKKHFNQMYFYVFNDSIFIGNDRKIKYYPFKRFIVKFKFLEEELNIKINFLEKEEKIVELLDLTFPIRFKGLPEIYSKKIIGAKVVVEKNGKEEIIGEDVDLGDVNEEELFEEENDEKEKKDEKEE